MLAVDITDWAAAEDVGSQLDAAPRPVGASAARPRAADRVVDGVVVGSLRGAARRDFTVEEDWAFWAWAVIEVLRHTDVRIEELLELSHHSPVGTSGQRLPLPATLLLNRLAHMGGNRGYS